MVKASIRMTNPDDAECTVTITMPLKDWKRLRQQLPPSIYPSWKISTVIEQLVGKAEYAFHYAEDKEP